MSEPARQAQPTRAERKERTRRTLLDGTMDLLTDRNFSALSLREVARAAGIVPTAFYRHFDSLDDLGVALAEESARVVRGVLRDLRRSRDGGAQPSAAVEAATALLADSVDAHPREFRFLTRERHGGSGEIRRAIEAEMRAAVSGLAIDLGREPALASATAEDLDAAAALVVTVLLEAAAGLLDFPRGHGHVLDRAARQLRLAVPAAGG